MPALQACNKVTGHTDKLRAMAANLTSPEHPLSASTLSSLVLELEARARAAQNLAELHFSLANDTHALLGFRQALVLDAQGRVCTVSGLVKLTEDSPYLLWLKRLWPWLQQQAGTGGWFAPLATELQAAPGDIAEGWQEWWTTGVYLLPLQRRTGEPLGWLVYLLDQAPGAQVVALLQHLKPGWAYAWEMLAGKPRQGLRIRWQALSRRRRQIILGLLPIFFLLPVRQTALAPAEIIALDASAVSSALDGVVKTIHVRPNQAVEAGDLLFSLDDTTLRNRLAVARQAVAVADAELRSASQLAFDDTQSKAQLAALSGQASERRAELAAVQAQLDRVSVHAAHAGVAIFSDPDDWRGRPVVTGERIMLLANPARPGILIHLPVNDAIAFEPEAQVKLFLTVRPLSPLSGRIIETSYQAEIDAQGVASYRLRADVAADQISAARIGLHGTAKLYGDWVVLGYYLMRKPLAKVREWTGW